MIKPNMEVFIPDLTKARVLNKWIKKGMKHLVNVPPELVTYIFNKLDDTVPKDALPVHVEKRKTYAKKFMEMSKPERIFELGGAWGATIAYQKGKISVEDLPDAYFSTFLNIEEEKPKKVVAPPEKLDALQWSEEPTTKDKLLFEEPLMTFEPLRIEEPMQDQVEIREEYELIEDETLKHERGENKR